MEKSLFSQLAIFCIVNIDRISDKNIVRIQDNNRKNFPNIRVFPAIMGKDLGKEDLKKYLQKKLVSYESLVVLRSGQIGCYLSHMEVLRRFLSSGKKYCLILEEDAFIRNNFKENLSEAFLELPEDFDVLYGDVREHQKQNNRVIDGKKNILKAGYLDGTLCYLVSRNGASKMLRSTPIKNLAVDNAIASEIRKQNINGFVMKKKGVDNWGAGGQGGMSTSIYTSTFLNSFFVQQFFWKFYYVFYFFFVWIPCRVLFGKRLPFKTSYLNYKFSFFMNLGATLFRYLRKKRKQA